MFTVYVYSVHGDVHMKICTDVRFYHSQRSGKGATEDNLCNKYTADHLS